MNPNRQSLGVKLESPNTVNPALRPGIQQQMVAQVMTHFQTFILYILICFYPKHLKMCCLCLCVGVGEGQGCTFVHILYSQCEVVI